MPPAGRLVLAPGVTVQPFDTLKQFAAVFAFGDDTVQPSANAAYVIPIPWACTITGWYAGLPVSGSATWAVSRASGITGTTFTSVGGTQPAISSAAGASSLTLNWTITTLSAGDKLRAVLSTITTANQATLVILLSKVI